MAFTTQRGRPRPALPPVDLGTPELRLKHSLRITVEPIDLCLEKELISQEQHWCGLHLRWLYTLRYGAPSLTTYYTDHEARSPIPQMDDPEWRSQRELEYHQAVRLLKEHKYYECIMRLTIFNERPAFLSHKLKIKSDKNHLLSSELERLTKNIRDGLDLLAQHWRPRTRPAAVDSSRVLC